MTTLQRLSVVASCLLAIIAVNQVNAIKCWECSTSALDGDFCADHFEPDKLTDEERKNSYKECAPPQNNGVRSVCKKLYQTSDGVEVVKRFCYYEDLRNDPEDCKKDPVQPNTITHFCGTCKTDLCNAASNQYPVVTILLIFSVPLIVNYLRF